MIDLRALVAMNPRVELRIDANLWIDNSQFGVLRVYGGHIKIPASAKEDLRYTGRDDKNEFDEYTFLLWEG